MKFIVNQGKAVLTLLTIIDLAYFTTCLTNTPPLLRAIFAFPSLFIVPGIILLTVLRRIIVNIPKLMIEGFFISTLLSTLFTIIMLSLGFALIPLNYALTTLIVIIPLSGIALIKRVEFKPRKCDILLITMAFLIYVALLTYFSQFPRLFTPDETSYIFSTRMGFLNYVVPPMGVRPDTREINILFEGRCFWIYLLVSFIGSTGFPVYQAGLLSISFLVMTSLASSIFIGNKWLRITVFILVIVNPLLFSFSALTLNDLAISFYAIFALLFFINSFSKNNNNVSISIRNLFCSLMGIIVLTMIKPNLLVFVSMWITLVYTMFRYRLYKQNWKYKALLLLVVLPVLLYELCFDIPYVISVWAFRNRELGALFGKFLFISPTERLVGWFLAPWWNPTEQTLFNHSFIDYIYYFYRILMPESSSILVSAVILALPVILPRAIRKDLDKTMLALLVLLSLFLFYLEALSSVSLGDVARFSMWMMPLWMPLTIVVLKDIKNSLSLRLLLPIVVTALILIWMNIWLSRNEGGVYVGYGLLSRLWTIDLIIVQLIVLMVILSLPLITQNLLKIRLVINKLSLERMINVRNVTFSVVIILIMLNGAYFSSVFIEKSQLYKHHGFIKISYILDEIWNKGDLVFANNYIHMRVYTSDELFKSGLLLPPPDTKEEFFKLLEIAPNNTLFLISDDDATTRYEYANRYIKNYANVELITLAKPNVPKLPRFNLTEPILKMTFDDADETTIPDNGDFRNNGKNYGVKVTEGYYGRALQFDGKGYVAIPDSEILNTRDELTISFLAKIDKAEPSKGYMILSKGYAAQNGSYHVFIWDGYIYFSIGEYQGSKRFLSVPVNDLVGTWHHFIFTYNGNSLYMFVDGVLIASNPARGPIRYSNFDLEIGRDSERKLYYFVGGLDELIISDKSFDLTHFAKCYFSSYALKIKDVSLPGNKVSLFKLVKSFGSDNAGNVKILNVNNVIDTNYTIMLNLEIESNISTKISILIATDRFTKVYDCFLNAGYNNITFMYPYVRDASNYEPGGIYWRYLTKPRIVLINGDRILFNEFIPIWDLSSINLLMLSITLAIIILALISFSLQEM